MTVSDRHSRLSRDSTRNSPVYIKEYRITTFGLHSFEEIKRRIGILQWTVTSQLQSIAVNFIKVKQSRVNTKESLNLVRLRLLLITQGIHHQILSLHTWICLAASDARRFITIQLLLYVCLLGFVLYFFFIGRTLPILFYSLFNGMIFEKLLLLYNCTYFIEMIRIL